MLGNLGYTYFTFLILTSYCRRTNFHGFFSSKGFSENCKHTESALKACIHSFMFSFIKDSILVRKTYFPSIIVGQRQYEPIKSLDLKLFHISSKLLSVLSGFLKDRKQRVTLNREVKGGVHHRPFFGLLLFFIYINDLADTLTSNAKLFTDDKCFCFW